jgi:hypothetical protein
MTSRLFRKEHGNGTGDIFCAQCGERVAGGAKFCAACGKAVPLRVCPSCATDNVPQAKFCAKCGQPLASEPSVPAPGSSAASVNAPPSAAAVRPQADGEKHKELPRASEQPSVPAGRPSEAPAAARSRTVDPGSLRTASPESELIAAAPEPVMAAAPPRRPVPPPAQESVVGRPAGAPYVADENPLRAASVPSAARTPAVTRDAPSARNRRPLFIGIGTLLVVLLVGAASYGYWTGLIGDRPGSIASEVTEELKRGGFEDVTVTMAKDWVAMITGTVVGQNQRQRLDEIVSGRSEIRSVDLTGLKVQPSLEEIEAAIAEALAQNGLEDIDAKVAEGGRVVLTGRARDSSAIGRAGETVANVPGVADVDNRIAIPFSELQREINDALRAGGFTKIRATVGPGGEVAAIGTLRAEEERSLVMEKIVATAAGLGEALEFSSIRDATVVEKPVIVTPSPRQLSAAAAAPIPAAEPQAAVPETPTSPFIGTWDGRFRGAILPYVAALEIRGAVVGEVAGESAYFGGGNLVCRGSLRLIDAREGQYTFEEKRRDVRNTCPIRGVVRLTLGGADAVQGEWSRPDSLEKPSYRGTLKKRP